MVSPPLVTVLLPAFNAANWLSAALDSVLAQSLSDFELLVIDDGSTDSTAELLGRYADTRLRVVRRANRGLVDVLNHGIELSRGKYIARMDADDVAHPRRLARQVTFLEAHPQVGICGTWFRVRSTRRLSRVRTPTGHDEIAANLFFRSAFGHPTVMFRRSFLEESGLRYDGAARHAEDFDLWVKARARTRFANIPKYLLEYRLHPGQTSAEYGQAQSRAAERVRLEQLAAMIPGATEEEKRLHLRTCDGHLFDGTNELLRARAWLDCLAQANRALGMFPSTAFGEALATTWAHCCQRARFSSSEVLRVYLSRRYSAFGLEMLRRHFVLARRMFAH